MAGLASLSQAFGGSGGSGEKRVSATLIAVGPDGSPVETTDEGEYVPGALRLQYFPDTISDNKGTVVSKRVIPGASLPIYQWISGGERIISFGATFTTDVDFISITTGQKDQSILQRLDNVGAKSRNQDPRAGVAWLRRFLIPSYSQNGSDIGSPLSVAPNRILLNIPHSGIGIAGGASPYGDDSVLCFLSQCDVVYEAFFPSGLPRIVVVSLAFTEVAQNNGTVIFNQDNRVMRDYILGNRDSTPGYTLTSTATEL